MFVNLRQSSGLLFLRDTKIHEEDNFVPFLVLFHSLHLTTSFASIIAQNIPLPHNKVIDEKRDFIFFSFQGIKAKHLCHLRSKSSENIYFSGIDGYFSEVRHDIFHGGKCSGTGRKHIFFKGFSLRDIKERDIFRKYPFWGHINANSIRFVVNPLENISFALWKIFIFTQILSKNLDSENGCFPQYYGTTLSCRRRDNKMSHFLRAQNQPFPKYISPFPRKHAKHNCHNRPRECPGSL